MASGVVRHMIRTRGAVLGAILVTAMALAGATAEATTTAEPTLRLLGSQDHVTVQRFEGGLHLDLGIYAAAQGGPLRIDVRRDGWSGPITARQGSRAIPAELLDGFRGMKGFLRLSFSQGGRRVARTSVTFCPNGWDRQRVDDSGPQQPTFPESCPSHFPFTRAMVWGIDAGWASNASWTGDPEGQQTVDLPPGDYDVVATISPAWARVLQVPADGRRVDLRVTVVQEEHPEEPRPVDARRHAEHRVDARTYASPPPGGRLPDLVALPAWRLSTESEGRRDHLSFASTPWNAGPGPFVVEGFRRRSELVMDAYQYFHDAQGRVVGRAPVGEMAFHAGGGHDHWHFLQFAAFDLLTPDGRTVVRSQKQGFCMAATDPVDLSLPGASMRPHNTDLGSACGGPRALWVREVLPAGWGDTYFNVSGQAFDITSLPNGRYLVRVRVDPMGALHQDRTDNDEAVRGVTLGGTRGARTVDVEPWNGVHDVPFPAPAGGGITVG